MATAHASDQGRGERRMREIRTSGATRGEAPGPKDRTLLYSTGFSLGHTWSGLKSAIQAMGLLNVYNKSSDCRSQLHWRLSVGVGVHWRLGVGCWRFKAALASVAAAGCFVIWNFKATPHVPTPHGQRYPLTLRCLRRLRWLIRPRFAGQCLFRIGRVSRSLSRSTPSPPWRVSS